jgi:hypothetical protein
MTLLPHIEAFGEELPRVRFLRQSGHALIRFAQLTAPTVEVGILTGSSIAVSLIK